MGAPDTDKDLRHNIAVNAAGEALWGLQAGLIAPMTVLAFALRAYGADARMIGSIGAVESGIIVLPQALGIYLFASRRGRKRRLILWHIVTFAPFLLVNAAVMLLAHRLPPAVVRWALFGGYALAVAGVGTVVSAWLDWVASLFDTRVRGWATGLAFSCSAVAGTLGALSAGWLLSRFAQAPALAALYAAAGLLCCISMAVFVAIRDPGDRATLPEPAPPGLREILARFRESLADRNFRLFLIGRVLATMGFCMVPLIALRYQLPEGGALAPGTVVAAGAAMTAGTALSTAILGRIGDRRGHRIGIITGALMQVVTLLILLGTHGAASCVLAYAGAGICAGAAFVSHNNMLFETCPHDHRMAHITIANLVLAIPFLAAPVAAGAAAEAWGLRPVFAACLAFSALAAAWFALAVREPRVADDLPLTDIGGRG